MPLEEKAHAVQHSKHRPSLFDVGQRLDATLACLKPNNSARHIQPTISGTTSMWQAAISWPHAPFLNLQHVTLSTPNLTPPTHHLGHDLNVTCSVGRRPDLHVWVLLLNEVPHRSNACLTLCGGAADKTWRQG